MKISLNALVHFDGTTLALELLSLSDEATGKPLIGTHGDLPDARVILCLREHGIEVFDRRQGGAAMAQPEATGEALLAKVTKTPLARVHYDAIRGFHTKEKPDPKPDPKANPGIIPQPFGSKPPDEVTL